MMQSDFLVSWRKIYLILCTYHSQNDDMMWVFRSKWNRLNIHNVSILQTNQKVTLLLYWPSMTWFVTKLKLLKDETEAIQRHFKRGISVIQISNPISQIRMFTTTDHIWSSPANIGIIMQKMKKKRLMLQPPPFITKVSTNKQSLIISLQ